MVIAEPRSQRRPELGDLGFLAPPRACPLRRARAAPWSSSGTPGPSGPATPIRVGFGSRGAGHPHRLSQEIEELPGADLQDLRLLSPPAAVDFHQLGRVT